MLILQADIGLGQLDSPRLVHADSSVNLRREWGHEDLISYSSVKDNYGNYNYGFLTL